MLLLTSQHNTPHHTTPHHTTSIFSQRIYEKYAGDKNVIIVEGDHNSNRPRFLFDSAAIFLVHILQVCTYNMKICMPKISRYFFYSRSLVSFSLSYISYFLSISISHTLSHSLTHSLSLSLSVSLHLSLSLSFSLFSSFFFPCIHYLFLSFSVLVSLLDSSDMDVE